jgi:hypothetical protein
MPASRRVPVGVCVTRWANSIAQRMSLRSSALSEPGRPSSTAVTVILLSPRILEVATDFGEFGIDS